jgi:hypothetical protein
VTAGSGQYWARNEREVTGALARTNCEAMRLFHRDIDSKARSPSMTCKHKSTGNVRHPGRSKADLGQKEAELEKVAAELEQASEQQLRHMEGGKAAEAARQQKAKYQSKTSDAADNKAR